MPTIKKETDILDNIQEFEEKLRLRGALTPKPEIKDALNVLERLGFTTSINSEITSIESDSGIKILSPFSQSPKFTNTPQPNKFGIISPTNLNQLTLDPSLKRIKFITNLLLRILILVIIVNFILIFIL